MKTEITVSAADLWWLSTGLEYLVDKNPLLIQNEETIDYFKDFCTDLREKRVKLITEAPIAQGKE